MGAVRMSQNSWYNSDLREQQGKDLSLEEELLWIMDLYFSQKQWFTD